MNPLNALQGVFQYPHCTQQPGALSGHSCCASSWSSPSVFARIYGFETIGLRYFNVFSPCQDPNGAYAAVIPKWTATLLKGEPVYINGDGENNRVFTFIQNAIQANLLAATSDDGARNQVYNMAAGDQTDINQLFALIRDSLEQLVVPDSVQPRYHDFRAGDVRHSLAGTNKAKILLGYVPSHHISEDIQTSILWYFDEKKLFT